MYVTWFLMSKLQIISFTVHTYYCFIFSQTKICEMHLTVVSVNKCCTCTLACLGMKLRCMRCTIQACFMLLCKYNKFITNHYWWNYLVKLWSNGNCHVKFYLSINISYFCVLMIFNNYSLKWRWIVKDILPSRKAARWIFFTRHRHWGE